MFKSQGQMRLEAEMRETKRQRDLRALDEAPMEHEQDLLNLLKFAAMALNAVRGANVGCDWDGGDIQDAMLKCGLLVEVLATEPCGETCHCVEYFGSFPQTCYRYSDLAETARASLS